MALSQKDRRFFAESDNLNCRRFQNRGNSIAVSKLANLELNKRHLIFSYLPKNIMLNIMHIRMISSVPSSYLSSKATVIYPNRGTSTSHSGH
jgi:hypothetical protein